MTEPDFHSADFDEEFPVGLDENGELHRLRLRNMWPEEVMAAMDMVAALTGEAEMRMSASNETALSRYMALSADAEKGDKDAEVQLREFLQEHPEVGKTLATDAMEHWDRDLAIMDTYLTWEAQHLRLLGLVRRAMPEWGPSGLGLMDALEKFWPGGRA